MAHSPEALDAFEQFAVETMRKRIMLFSALFATLFLLSSMVGRISLEGMPEAKLERVLLPIQALGSFTCWALLRFVPWAQRHPIVIACLTYPFVSWAGGLLVGDLGGLDGPSFYGIYTLPSLVIVLPCRLPHRASVTAALVLPFALAYFVPHPEYLLHPLVHIPAVYVVSVTVVSLVAGHWIYGLTRDRFLFAIQIEEQRELLAQHNAQLKEEVVTKSSAVERLAARIETVRFDERTDLARSLHDDLGQLIVGARMELGNIERVLSGERAPEGDDLSFLYEIVESLARSTKRLVGDLRDEGPEHAPNVAESIEALVAPIRERAKMDVTTRVDLAEALPAATRETIYRTVQEAMTNILKHAKAKHARIVVRSESSVIGITISDDGVGFDASDRPAGWGLIGVRERVESLGGELSIESSSAGTHIEARLPIDS